MNCDKCYGCLICRNHKVIIDKVSENEKVDKKVATFGVKRTLSGKLIGVRNETETSDKKDS